MTSEGGLQKLTEYLNQTRRQAEAAIDTLNEKIFELETSNALLSKANDELNIERTYLKDLVEQLKGENSRKWRLQERDDWKSLVDSVQADRVRLQEENMQLSLLLEQANTEIERQAELLGSLTGLESGSQPVSPGRASAPRLRMSTDSCDDAGAAEGKQEEREHTELGDADGSLAVSCPSPTERAGSSSTSPVRVPPSSKNLDNSGSSSMSKPGSPAQKAHNAAAVIQQLRLELEQVTDQRLVEKQILETEIRGLKDEIERLQHQLQLARGNGVDADLDHNPLAVALLGDADSSVGRSGVPRSAEPANQAQWSLSFGLWDYFFSSNDDPQPAQLNKTILRV